MLRVLQPLSHGISHRLRPCSTRVEFKGNFDGTSYVVPTDQFSDAQPGKQVTGKLGSEIHHFTNIVFILQIFKVNWAQNSQRTIPTCLASRRDG